MKDVLAKLTSQTWPWMAVAFVLVAGFMYWLYAESSSITSTLVAADTTETVPVVSDTAFVIDPTQYSRNRIMLYGVIVTEQIGRAALTIDLPGLAGYPVILDRSVMEQEMTIVGGDNLAIAGQVYALNDSLLDVYLQRGFFDPENREKIEGHTTFFLVDSLDLVFPEESTPQSGGQ